MVAATPSIMPVARRAPTKADLIWVFFIEAQSLTITLGLASNDGYGVPGVSCTWGAKTKFFDIFLITALALAAVMNCKILVGRDKASGLAKLYSSEGGSRQGGIVIIGRTVCWIDNNRGANYHFLAAPNACYQVEQKNQDVYPLH